MTTEMIKHDQAIKHAAERCQARGERFTAGRREVFALLLDAGRPVTAYQLLDTLRESQSGAQPPTVYRALEFLQRVGLIHRIDATNSYLPCAMECCGEHHEKPPQLLVCNHCGAATEMPLPEGVYETLCEAAEAAGFELGDKPLALNGLCDRCH